MTLALSAPAALAQDGTGHGDNDNREDRIENRIDRLEDRYDSFDVDFEDGFGGDEGVLISVDEGDLDFDGDLDEIEFLEDGGEDYGILDELESVTVVYDVDGHGFFEDYESLVVVYDVDGDGIDDLEDAFLI